MNPFSQKGEHWLQLFEDGLSQRAASKQRDHHLQPLVVDKSEESHASIQQQVKWTAVILW